MQTIIQGFHAHLYFTAETRASAEKIHGEVSSAFATKARVSRLVDRPIGPHPVPMFEIDFANSEFNDVVTWLMLHHQDHSVLIHPVTGDDMIDHTVHPLWLGKQLTLDLSRL